ncbi:MFS general substrate transporter [Microstroma glucosiphilum]|uniref:MFS general substrate transporter n=1 Tax=Pseudomicrostroma glucosiphilum TaxID=1684307 RepID=A0A316U9P6_9BASI|nr:MFS general substrate transporter [Pseudomicrostroma glucosiphilum]PWN19725.1 MFS general substrate transporter [Pseudomicrostroma glucosiphilum]
MSDLEKRGEAGSHPGAAAPLNGGNWSSEPTVAADRSASGSPPTTSAGHTEVHSSGHDNIAAEKKHSGEGDLVSKPREGEVKSDRVKRKVEDLESEGYVLVGFEDGDPENPRNWSKAYKYFLVSFCSYLNVCVASQASAYSTGSSDIQEEFGISSELATVGLSLYVLGFAIGPPIVAPLSEQFGRKPVYLICWALWVLMSFPIAFSPTIEGILICRFLAGLMASPPLSNTGGVVSDLFARDFSGKAMAIYTFGSCIGPATGNVYASFIAPKLGWRWIYYLTALLIFGLHLPIIYFVLPETRHNIIIERKAARLRKEASTDKFVSVHATEKKSLAAGLKISLTRPFRFLFTEPITMFASAWNGFLYGLIFLFNDAFAEIWGPGNGGYGWSSAGLVQLTFLSLIIGTALAALSYPLIGERFYQKRIREAGESVPEARMFAGCFGCVLLPIGLFLTAWTCYPDRIVWIVPLLGPAIFGYGFFFVLFGILTYLTDSYGAFSASALGAAILIRSESTLPRLHRLESLLTNPPSHCL